MEKATRMRSFFTVTNNDLILGVPFPNSAINISKYLIQSLFHPYLLEYNKN